MAAKRRRRLLVWGAMASLYIYCMVYMQRLLQAAVDGPRPAGPCAEKRNFVFIKCMKCATETMGTVLRRFGYIRNQSFVVPAGSNIYLGWPFLMKERDYRPSRRGFSILTEHAVYNRSIMRRLMPPDTIYISIVREPFAHFVSVFHYFRVGDIANVSGPDPVAEYLTNPDRYERAYKGHGVAGVRHCIPDNFSITKNLLSHCLGMPTGFPRGRPDLTGDSAAVAGYIGELVEAFDLVMLVEYFHESLVLLRRLMCWSLKDILYHRSNEGGYERRSWPPGVRDLHRRWSGADYALYDRFNRTFWAKVRKEGENFFEEEVRHFVDIQRRVSGFCEDGRTGSITIQQSRWNDVFTLSRSECTLMNTYILYLIKSRCSWSISIDRKSAAGRTTINIRSYSQDHFTFEISESRNILCDLVDRSLGPFFTSDCYKRISCTFPENILLFIQNQSASREYKIGNCIPETNRDIAFYFRILNGFLNNLQ